MPVHGATLLFEARVLYVEWSAVGTPTLLSTGFARRGRSLHCRERSRVLGPDALPRAAVRGDSSSPGKSSRTPDGEPSQAGFAVGTHPKTGCRRDAFVGPKGVSHRTFLLPIDSWRRGAVGSHNCASAGPPRPWSPCGGGFIFACVFVFVIQSVRFLAEVLCILTVLTYVFLKLCFLRHRMDSG